MCKQYFPREIVGVSQAVRAGAKSIDLPIDGFDEYTEPEDWRFTKDKPEFHESGRVYRKQVLATNSKQTRTVEVDIDNPDEIVRAM